MDLWLNSWVQSLRSLIWILSEESSVDVSEVDAPYGVPSGLQFRERWRLSLAFQGADAWGLAVLGLLDAFDIVGVAFLESGRGQTGKRGVLAQLSECSGTAVTQPRANATC